MPDRSGKQHHLRLPEDLHARLSEIVHADYRYASLTHLIVTVLWDFVHRWEDPRNRPQKD